MSLCKEKFAQHLNLLLTSQTHQRSKSRTKSWNNFIVSTGCFSVSRLFLKGPRDSLTLHRVTTNHLHARFGEGRKEKGSRKIFASRSESEEPILFIGKFFFLFVEWIKFEFQMKVFCFFFSNANTDRVGKDFIFHVGIASINNTMSSLFSHFQLCIPHSVMVWRRRKVKCRKVKHYFVLTAKSSFIYSLFTVRRIKKNSWIIITFKREKSSDSASEKGKLDNTSHSFFVLFW